MPHALGIGLSTSLHSSEGPVFDIIILGGGLAGLSLATRLCQPRFSHLRVLVLEPLTDHRRDKTWCRWSTSASLFDEAVTQSWSKWSVTAGGSTHISESSDYRYELIASDRLCHIALCKIAASSNVSLLGNMAVSGLVLRGDYVDVLLAAGSMQSRLVFDSRRPSPHVASRLINTLSSVEIETEEDFFDTSAFTLMDFSVAPASADSIRFVHLLPLSSRRALIQDTSIVPRAHEPFASQSVGPDLRSYLADRLNVSKYRVLRHTRGRHSISGTPAEPSRSARVIRIGLAAGISSCCRGYAFDEIQRGCDRLAAAIAPSDDLEIGPVSNEQRSMGYWIDRIFLSVLENEPAAAPKLFLSIFRNTDTDALVRFLSGVATWTDALRVIAACPKSPFITAAALGAWS